MAIDTMRVLQKLDAFLSKNDYKSAMNVVFLLHKKYMPYYKWCFRALKELGERELAERL